MIAPKNNAANKFNSRRLSDLKLWPEEQSWIRRGNGHLHSVSCSSIPTLYSKWYCFPLGDKVAAFASSFYVFVRLFNTRYIKRTCEDLHSSIQEQDLAQLRKISGIITGSVHFVESTKFEALCGSTPLHCFCKSMVMDTAVLMAFPLLLVLVTLGQPTQVSKLMKVKIQFPHLKRSLGIIRSRV